MQYVEIWEGWGAPLWALMAVAALAGFELCDELWLWKRRRTLRRATDRMREINEKDGRKNHG